MSAINKMSYSELTKATPANDNSSKERIGTILKTDPALIMDKISRIKIFLTEKIGNHEVMSPISKKIMECYSIIGEISKGKKSELAFKYKCREIQSSIELAIGYYNQSARPDELEKETLRNLVTEFDSEINNL